MDADQNILSKYKANASVEAVLPVLSFSCPHCGNAGTFAGCGKGYSFRVTEAGRPVNLTINQRICPNRNCLRAIVTISENDEVVATFPPVRLGFDTQGIPERIAECLEEAITCHASGAHRASALMVRRTLEELCEDRGASGSNLNKRLHALADKVLMPKELFDAMDDLRLLGNDAAHVEAKIYEDIGAVEIETAIELTKEILKASYQYTGLVARLRSLKNPK